ncbi:hypothetical protein [Bradyrhizobium sp. SZCCHNR2028]|uniref:hypothetical protein n=1 Tax=Bradyrhizobium sp. SZCCHNR2028 TaxID=3057382 RepID=UPI0028E37672|nr:hypothetical protein [Bradyrhizobium sp. SZCCHNR2028]
MTDAPGRPEWISGTTHKDWLRDGYRVTEEQWADLDWNRAWVDMGPSPAGNLGPYWHVPLKSGETVHRLYPRLPSKWRRLVKQAIVELSASGKSERP